MQRVDALQLNISVDNVQALAALRATTSATAAAAAGMQTSGQKMLGAFGNLQPAIAPITQLRGALGGLDFSLKENAETWPKWTGSFAGAALKLGGLTFAMNLVVGQLSKLAAQADDIDDLSRSFETLSNRAGISTDVLDRLRVVTEGEATRMDLMRNVNLALTADLPLTNARLEEMFRVATRLGAAMGLDATEAVERFTGALVRQSDKQLALLGVNLDAESAMKRYALSVNKAVEDLTEAERKQVFMNEALSAAAVASRGLEDATGSLSGGFRALSTSIRDATNELIHFLDTIPQRKGLEEFGSAAGRTGFGGEFMFDLGLPPPPSPGMGEVKMAEMPGSEEELRQNEAIWAEIAGLAGSIEKEVAKTAISESKLQEHAKEYLRTLEVIEAEHSKLRSELLRDQAGRGPITPFVPPQPDTVMLTVEGDEDLIRRMEEQNALRERSSELLNLENEAYAALLLPVENLDSALGRIQDWQISMIESGGEWKRSLEAQGDALLSTAAAAEQARVVQDLLKESLLISADALWQWSQTGEISAKRIANAIARQVFATLSARAIEEVFKGISDTASAASYAALATVPGFKWAAVTAAAYIKSASLHYAAAAKAGGGAGAALAIGAATAPGQQGGLGGGTFAGGRASGSLATSGSTPLSAAPEQVVRVYVFLEGQGFVQDIESFAHEIGERIARQARRTGA